MQLAARVWLPEDARVDPVPAILEYLPYRKGDWTAARDAVNHLYVAGHGYACVRVDMRGSGDSDGILEDEYLPREQEDAVEVISWIASQPWCSGRVGIFGKSWGGFNALQIAARRPRSLAGVISLCSTDDRYADDVHYIGGCLLASDMLSWSATMLAFNARPPDPDVVGERWHSVWRERLERTAPYIHRWLSHQRRDAYWRHGSICENYDAIECPVYLVGGWADAHRDAILRMLSELSCPRKGLIGPWAHLFPHTAVPGPRVGFLQECLRWWDYWLKGIETKVMDEPMLRVWMQEWVEPGPYYEKRPGRWVAEASWPSPLMQQRRLFLNEDGLASTPAAERVLECAGSERAGLDAGARCPFGYPGDFAPDQRAEDEIACTFTSAPLERSVEILGFPELTLTLESDRPLALVAVRLCDVGPDGSSLLVTRGLLNLTHRNGHEQPEPLEPEQPYQVTVCLNAIAHSFRMGHRIRVTVTPSYWPWAWPSPEPVRLTVSAGADSWLELPTRLRRVEDLELRPFGAPEGAPSGVEVVRASAVERTIHHNVDDGLIVFEVDNARWGHRRLPDGLEFAAKGRNTFTIREGDPQSAQGDCRRTVTVGRGAWQVRIETTSSLTADAQAFHLHNRLDAYEGDAAVFGETWSQTIARDHL